jgi:hypothetical protein
LLFEFGFQGFNFLEFLKFFLTEWFTGLQLIILNLYLKELMAFPAPARAFVIIRDERDFGFRITLGTF